MLKHTWQTYKLIKPAKAKACQGKRAYIEQTMTSNQLKIIALVAMTIDHIGYFVFPHILGLRIIGRLAFPIFAFMIAEGCFYTRNKWRYLGTMFACALIMQLVYLVCMNSLYQSIMTTFTLSILTVIALQNANKKRDFLSICLLILMLAADVFICKFLGNFLPTFQIDYGLFGVLLPAITYLPHFFKDKIDGSCCNNKYCNNSAELEHMAESKKHISKKMRYMMITCFAIGLLLLCFDIVRPNWNIQWYSLLSIVLLLFYNGKRGTWHMKYLFYIYYPCHIAVLYVIGQIVQGVL